MILGQTYFYNLIKGCSWITICRLELKKILRVISLLHQDSRGPKINGVIKAKAS